MWLGKCFLPSMVILENKVKDVTDKKSDALLKCKQLGHLFARNL